MSDRNMRESIEDLLVSFGWDSLVSNVNISNTLGIGMISHLVSIDDPAEMSELVYDYSPFARLTKDGWIAVPSTFGQHVLDTRSARLPYMRPHFRYHDRTAVAYEGDSLSTYVNELRDGKQNSIGYSLLKTENRIADEFKTLSIGDNGGPYALVGVTISNLSAIGCRTKNNFLNCLNEAVVCLQGGQFVPSMGNKPYENHLFESTEPVYGGMIFDRDFRLVGIPSFFSQRSGRILTSTVPISYFKESLLERIQEFSDRLDE